MKNILMVLLTILLILSGCGQTVKTVTDERMTLDVRGGHYYGAYTGEVTRGNVPNGTGAFSSMDALSPKWSYDGEWVDGDFCGNGVFTWEDGSYFVGEYTDSRNAAGTYYSTGGYEYDAVIENGIKALTPLELGTDLFEQVYVPYANRERPSDFGTVAEYITKYAADTGYTLEITDATTETIGTIQINDSNNGDHVFIAYAFSNETDDQYVSTVSYYQAYSNSEVSMSNYSGSSAKSYD